MDTLNKILLENIGIDFRFGDYLGMQHMLCEVHGYVPNLDEYLECIMNEVSLHIPELIKQGCIQFKIDESAFASMENKFFDMAMFDVVLAVGNRISNVCSYRHGESGIVNGKKFVKFEICLSDNTLLELISTINKSVSHELLHAYQDMSTIEKSGTRMSDTFNIDRYGRIIRAYNNSCHNGNRDIRELTLLLYTTEPIEMNAFIGELKADLRTNHKFINGSRKAEEAIKSTETYKKLLFCWNILDKLRDNTDENKRLKIVQVYNEIFETNIKSYKKIVKLIASRVERFSNHVLERASKIAYDVFAEKKPINIK